MASPDRRETPTPFLFHHSIRSEYARYATITPPPNERIKDRNTRIAYDWLTEKIRFVPIFLAVGNTTGDLQKTGFPHPDTLFSFSDVPNGIFTDHQAWEQAIAHTPVIDEEAIFHPTWTIADWHRRIQESPGSVQVLVPSLDLTKSISVLVGNDRAQNRLERAGFKSPRLVRFLEDAQQIIFQSQRKR